MDLTLGTRLRLQREQQQVALSTIAQQTKIKLSLLEALERDDVSRWPDGIFRRAYIRAYAEAIGLDPDDVAREFLELHPCAEIIPSQPLDPFAGDGGSRRHPPMRLRFLIDSAIAALPPIRQRAEKQPAAAQPAVPCERNTMADSASTLGDCGTRDDSVSAGRDSVLRMSLDTESSLEQFATEPPHLYALADLCTRIGRAADIDDVEVLLEDAATILGAVGLIVWSWDSRVAALKPFLAYGYPSAVLAQLASVRRDADNALAAVFRAQEPRVVDAASHATGAVVVPVVAATGCVGVLAIELPHGRERREQVKALATILAAQLVTLVGLAPLAEAVNA